jgi:hypothetical protein
MGGVSRTFSFFMYENCTYSFWGVYHGHLGGVSRTFGGCITDIFQKKTFKNQYVRQFFFEWQFALNLNTKLIQTCIKPLSLWKNSVEKLQNHIA